MPHRYMRGVHHALPYTGTLDSFALWNAARRLHRERRFDVIHERFGLYSYGAILTSRHLGIPLVLEVNGPSIEEKQLFTTPLSGAQLFVARAIRDQVARQASRIVVVSSVLKQFLLKHWKGVHDDQIVVIPNAADVARLADLGDVTPLRTRLGLENALTIGFLGTFQPWYGLEKLIEAFAAVVPLVPQARLLMVGDGVARDGLERLARETGVHDSILFTGYVPHVQVPQYLGCFDIAVAAFRELAIDFCGSPIKLFEYMAAGRTIVASRIGQIPEIVTHERDALLVEPGNIAELADALVRLAGDAPLRKRLGAAARLTGRRYSWEAYVEQLVGVYRSAMQLDRQ